MGKEVAKSPIVLREGYYGDEDLDSIQKNPIWQLIDIYDQQSQDLFEIEHPKLIGSPSFHNKANAFANERSQNRSKGDWVYYPWDGILLHCASEAEQFRLRTNRNKQLVSDEEQSKLSQAKLAIAGLSVGGQIAIGLVYSGIANSLSLADHDTLETSNLNRVRAKLSDIGLAKADVLARQIWNVSPYAKLKLFGQGINENNIDNFLDGADLVFDEIDDFKMKVIIRHRAKSKRIPVLMLTGLGDTVLIDIERYDLDPKINVFNGLIGDLEDKILNNEVTPEDEKRYAAQIIGVENVPTKALNSLLDIGSTLVGRPQLGSTVTLESGIGSFLVRQVLLGDTLKTGRYRLSLTDILNIKSEVEPSKQRQEVLKKLLGS